MEDREARRRANVLLMREMNNSCMLVAPAGTPAPPESREAGAQTPVWDGESNSRLLRGDVGRSN